MPMVAQPLRELPTLAIWFFAQTAKSLWSLFRSSSNLSNGCATIGISQGSQLSKRDLPMK
jgi:phage tail sheath gpL-like